MKLDEKGVAIIPEGYKWCDECLALTPHIPGERRWNLNCVICNTSNFIDYACPNCGYPNPENPEGPRIVTVHREGCHFSEEMIGNEDSYWYTTPIAKRLVLEFKEDWTRKHPGSRGYKQWEDAFNTKCGCPEYTIYPDRQAYNYKSWIGNTMECINAIDWSYDIRCPICGLIYEISDGNC